MSTRSFKYSNNKQREYQKVKSESEWIIKTSNSYDEAFKKLKKLKLCGSPLFDSTIDCILKAKDTLNLNPKLKKRKIKTMKKK